MRPSHAGPAPNDTGAVSSAQLTYSRRRAGAQPISACVLKSLQQPAAVSARSLHHLGGIAVAIECSVVAFLRAATGFLGRISRRVRFEASATIGCVNIDASAVVRRVHPIGSRSPTMKEFVLEYATGTVS